MREMKRRQDELEYVKELYEDEKPQESKPAPAGKRTQPAAAQPPVEDIEDFRFEIENRIRNLCWTVSGDYSLNVKLDVESYVHSKYISLYDAVKQGAFSKYFDREAFGLYLVPSLYLMLFVVGQYRIWSSNPQIQDYIFDLLGAMALMFFLIYWALFCVGMGRRRPQLFMGLAAVYLCLVAQIQTVAPFLYAGGMGFAATGLCSLYPVAKPVQPEEKEA